MRDKFQLFVADVVRYGPLTIVALATLLSVPSLSQLIGNRLSVTSMLGRYFVALFISTVGVQVVSQLLIRYARRNMTNNELDTIETQGEPQPDRA